MIKTVNNELLNIEVINNIEISLLNNEFLILSEVMYILILMINLTVILRLWHKSFNVLYSADQLYRICLFNDQLIINADMSNNQYILKIVNFKIVNAMTSTIATTIFVKEIYIFVFAKFIIDIKI